MSRPLPFAAPIANDFLVTVSEEGTLWRVECRGTVDHVEASSLIQPVLMKLHEEVVAGSVARVQLDVQHVDYMNSSGLKGFITWFLAAEYGNNGQPYQIEFLYDRRKTWQAVSSAVMEKVAPRSLKARAVQDA